MHKQKILIVHNYYQIPGGEDTVVANEKKMLEDNGHNVYLYTRNNSEINKYNVWGKIFLGFNSLFSLKTYIDVKMIIKKNNIDIVHVHNTLSLISPSVYYAAFHSKVPIVQTIHNFRLICPAATLYRNNYVCEECIKKGLYCAIKHKCYRNSLIQTLVNTAIIKVHRFIGTYKKVNMIFLTEFNKDKVLQINNKNTIVDSNKIYIKPNCVNVKRKVIPFIKRKNQIIYVGRLDKLKGIKLLLEEWRNIKNINLVIYGNGEEEEWCRKYIEKNNMSNVKMKGYVKNSEVIDEIAKSKALILLTQWYEGFPMTLVESWGCGTPVIGSDFGNVGGLIKENINGWKYNCNLSEVVASIDDIVDKCKTDSYNFSSVRNYEVLKKIYDNCSK